MHQEIQDREVSVLRLMNHPNVVKLVAVEEEVRFYLLLAMCFDPLLVDPVLTSIIHIVLLMQISHGGRLAIAGRLPHRPACQL